MLRLAAPGVAAIVTLVVGRLALDWKSSRDGIDADPGS
jgi:hypothetical protein